MAAKPLLGDVTPVLMAKRPDAGQVKTRLTAAGGYSPRIAAQVADAMLRCVAGRLEAASTGLVLAVSPAGCGEELTAELGLGPGQVVEQGDGDLGQRLDRVWREVGKDRPVAFFGADSPDVPDSALAEIPAALAGCDVAVGPTDDGGYWTLAAGEHLPQVLCGIDWGEATVYDLTRRRAADAGLVVRALPMWHDVDRPEDVEALRRRLQQEAGRRDLPAPLEQLAGRLDALCPSSSPGRTPS
ncbi:MAG: TIGR04282 family arsenosugar biosynthesis glycosyltransferase [Planctomycetota bacterium]